jgi:DNA-binding protein HU-beta
VRRPLCVSMSSGAADVEVPVSTDKRWEYLVNRSELVNAVAEKTDTPRAQVDAVLAAMLDQIIAATATEKVILAGFGTFEARDRAAREGRNPATGAPLQIAASRGVGFKPAAAFKQHVAGTAG